MALGLSLFLILVFVFTFLLVLKPRSTFLLILGALIVFYVPLSQGVILFTVGSAKVYPGDIVIASVFVFLLLKLFRRKYHFIPKSVIIFSLFFFWGAIAILRGFPRYGYSAVGEARWYILPLLYYFFVLISFRDNQQVRWIAKWFVYLTLFMIAHHYIDFYFMSGKERIPASLLADPRSTYRFINAFEGLLISFALISILLFYMRGKIRKHQIFIYLIFGILLLSIIFPQTRSVWVAAAVGLVMTGSLMGKWFVSGKLHWQSGFLILLSLFLLTLFPLAIGIDGVFKNVTKSALFFQNPLEDPTGSWRLMGWEQELKKAMQSPLFGEGLGGYSEWFDGQQWQRVAVHNGYIMHFSKFGVVGLVLLLLGVIYWYFEMLRYVRTERDLFYKLLSYAIQVSVLMHLVFAIFFDFTIFFWLLLAAGSVLVRSAMIRSWYRHNYGNIITVGAS